MPSVLYRLLRVAEVRQVGATSTLRLTQASLLRGLAAGERLEDLLAFLAAHSAYALPQNVRYTLNDWAKHYQEVSISDLVMFETSSEDAAAALCRVATEVGIALRLLAPGILVARRVDLSPTQLGSLRAQVERIGIVVRMPKT